jgi:hypothetical protein
MVDSRAAALSSASASELSSPIYLGTLPNGPLLILRDNAALIYRICLDAGDDAVAGVVAEALGESEETIAAMVADFVEELVTAGVLERTSDPATP